MSTYKKREVFEKKNKNKGCTSRILHIIHSKVQKILNKEENIDGDCRFDMF